MKWLADLRRDRACAAGHTPAEQAAYWLARSQLSVLRRDEEAAFARWREEPQNEAELAALKDLLDDVRSGASEPGIGVMRAEALAQQPAAPSRTSGAWLGAAAALAALFVVPLLWRAADRSPAATDAALQVDVHQTLKGQRRVVSLADGSRVTLNTDSRVEVVLAADKRTLRLVRGQAMFEVAKDKDRPFAVMAGPLEVTALGTQFDVRLDHGRAKVVLVEGRIAVEPLARHGVARLLPVLERRYLNAGEQLIAKKEQDRMSVGVADVEQSTSWQFGRLVFRGEPLGDAVEEFNRYSDRQLRIADAELAQLPVSGVFSIARPENFLAAVASFYPVRVEERSPRLAVLTHAQ